MLRDVLKKFPFAVNLHANYWKPFKIRKNYLEPLGYFRPHPSNLAAEALPWFTYPAIILLESVIQKHWKVFEYGSGYSTVFWNSKCEKTVSVEHDENWFNLLRKRNPDFEIYLVQEGIDRQKQAIRDLLSSFEAMNFELPVSADHEHNRNAGLLNIEFTNYAAKLAEFQKEFFDVIVVDGMARDLCLFLAAEYVANKGIIILDNSDRWQYNSLQEYLCKEKKFLQLDLSGLGPINTYGWTTSFFFKDPSFLQKAKCLRERGMGDLGW